ncbi:MAG: protein kinase [Myxococcota bacterium]
MVDNLSTKASDKGAASLDALDVDLEDLPREVRERVTARAESRQGRLTIGRYLITGELGRGGMGVVYDAWDPRIERRVAVKTIEPDLVPDEAEREEVIERFRREIKVVGKLQHPAIVTIFDYGEDPELRRGDSPYAPGRIYYYVMEYLEGRSLAKILREKKAFSDLEATSIALDIADALVVAHARGVIHRDIKPSNILIRADQRAVLLDFGIAKTGSVALTRQGQILGTPTYLAPERLREKEDGLDGRADIFSLGVLVYTLLAGEAPFQGQNVYDLLDNIQRQSHARISRNTPGGAALSKALDRMLAKRPQDRYQSADEVGSALRHVRTLLEESTPDVSDLGTGLVLVQEAMTDASTEIATPSEPVPVVEVQKPGDPVGTSPEVSLRRATRRINVSEELEDPVPEVLDPAEISEREIEALDAEGTDSGDARMPTIPSRQKIQEKPPENGGGVTLRQSQSVLEVEASDLRRAMEAAAPPEPKKKEPARRLPSIDGEDETVAEPSGLPDNGRSAGEVRVRAADPAHADAATEHAPLITRAPNRAAKNRRPRIEASLVDEEEVVVRPAPLESLRPDEIPTQTGVPVKTPSGGVGVPQRPADPIETDIVRPRKIVRDPAEPAAPTRPPPGQSSRKPEEPGIALHEPDARPSASSAAVARRTIGARGQSGARRPANRDFAEIEVKGTNLDNPAERAKTVRARIVLLLGAAFCAVAFGLFLGRMRSNPDGAQRTDPSPSESAPASDAPIPHARPAEAKAAVQADVVAPRSAAEILADAEKAYADARLGDADRLYLRAIEAATEGGETHVRALVGRARVLSTQGEPDRAAKLLERVIELRGSGPEAKEARTLLEAMGRTAPAPRRPAPSAPSSAAPAPTRAAPSPEPSERPRPASNAALDQLPVEEQCTELLKRNLSNKEAGVEAFEALVARYPAAPCAYRQLGVFYNKLGNDQRAVEAWRMYLKLQPNAPDKGTIQQKIDAVVSRMSP